MKISSFNFKKIFFLAIILSYNSVIGQDTTKFIQRIHKDTGSTKLNMDALYNRPFLTFNKVPIAIGGYIEANTNYTTTNGVNDGFHFHIPRMTLFFATTIAKKIKFIAELEFEEGTKEINIETGLIDIEFHPLLTFRGGIILNPIGGFNQNHDGPRWDFIDRPLAATEIIPATLSSVGMGFYGKYFYQNWIIGYEAYFTNGFNDKLISNEKNRTSFHESKEGNEKFSRSNSGLPMFNGKVAIRNRKLGEIGISFLTGVYNEWKKNGLIIDDKRTASIFAIDYNTSLFNNKLNITGEVSKAFIQMPTNYIENYGRQQLGAFTDVVFTIKQGKVLGWEKAKINIGARIDFVDHNIGKFAATTEEIQDHVWAITPSIALRPVGMTVLRLNYTYQLTRDIVGNGPSKMGSIKFGISSYF